MNWALYCLRILFHQHSAPDLARKYQPKVEAIDSGKQSSLFR